MNLLEFVGSHPPNPPTGTSAPIVSGWDGVVRVNGSGVIVNGHGTPVQLRGVNIANLDSGIYSNQPVSTQAWSQMGAGGPPFPTYATWKPNAMRMTLNASAWLNVDVGIFTTTSTAAAPAWSGSLPSDPNGIYKNAVLAALQWARYYKMYSIIDTHFNGPRYTFGGTTHFIGAYGQPPFMDNDCSLPFWTAGYGAGPGTTDVAGYPSSGFVAQLLHWFGAPGYSLGNGAAAGPYYDPTIGGVTGIQDFVLELFNEPYLTNQSFNFNTANLGAGTALTAEQIMKSGGWVSGFWHNGAGPGIMGTPGNNAGTQVGIPGSVYTLLSVSGNGTTVTMTMTGYGLGALAVGQPIRILGVTGATGYNGTWTIASSSISVNTITITFTSAVTGAATVTGALAYSGVLGPSGQTNTTTDPYLFNWWWQATGYQPVLAGIRALNANNIILCNGLGYSTMWADAYQWFPTDTLSPQQVGIGWHPYGASGFPNSLDPEHNTAFELQYPEAYIAGAASFTINGTVHTGLGFPVPVVATESGDNGGAGYATPIPYLHSVTQWADGGTDTTNGVTFVGTFGVFPWWWFSTGVNAADAGGAFYLNYYSTGVTIQGYLTPTYNAGFPINTGTLTVTNANGNTIVPGAVLWSGTTLLYPFIGPQISGTPGGAGTYVCSVATTQGSSGSPLTLTVKYQVPINGGGQTFYNWTTAHAP